MPASRSARAMTLAPRSCPSSPGLAMTTLSLRTRQSAPRTSHPALCIPHSAIRTPQSNDRHLFVLAPDLTKRVAHLADRRVGAHGVEDRRHEVLARLRGGAQAIEGLRDRAAVARPAQPLELGELRFGRRLVDVEDLDGRFVRLHEVVDADDGLVL